MSEARPDRITLRERVARIVRSHGTISIATLREKLTLAGYPFTRNSLQNALAEEERKGHIERVAHGVYAPIVACSKCGRAF